MAAISPMSFPKAKVIVSAQVPISNENFLVYLKLKLVKVCAQCPFHFHFERGSFINCRLVPLGQALCFQTFLQSIFAPGRVSGGACGREWGGGFCTSPAGLLDFLQNLS